MAAVTSRRNLQIWAVGTLAGNIPGPAPFWRPWKSLARGIGVFAGGRKAGTGQAIGAGLFRAGHQDERASRAGRSGLVGWR